MTARPRKTHWAVPGRYRCVQTEAGRAQPRGPNGAGFIGPAARDLDIGPRPCNLSHNSNVADAKDRRPYSSAWTGKDRRVAFTRACAGSERNVPAKATVPGAGQFALAPGTIAITVHPVEGIGFGSSRQYPIIDQSQAAPARRPPNSDGYKIR